MPDDSSSPVHPEPAPQPSDLMGTPSVGIPVATPPAPPLDAPGAPSFEDPPSQQPEAAWVLPPRQPGPGLLATVGWMLLFLGLQVAFVIPWVIVVGLKNLGRHLGTVAIVLVVVNFILEIGLVALALRSQFARVLAVRSIHPIHVVLVLLLVLPLATLDMSIALWGSGRAHQPSGQDVPQVYQGLAELPMPALLVIACLLPALGEEIFFRGFLARGLVARHGLVVGVAVSSILFGLMHPDSLAHIIATTLLGVAAYAVFLGTKTLWAPVLLHALNNGIAFGAERLFNYFGVEVNGDAPDIPVALVLTAAVAVLALLVVLYQTRTRWVLPSGRPWAPGYLTTEMPPRIVAAHPEIALPRLGAAAAALAACGAFGWALVTSF